MKRNDVAFTRVQDVGTM